MQVFGRSEGKDHFKNLGLIGRAILKLIFKKKDGVMNWIDLSHDRDSWEALVNVVMNIQVQ
jgi:hypothetical protein